MDSIMITKESNQANRERVEKFIKNNESFNNRKLTQEIKKLILINDNLIKRIELLEININIKNFKS
jgi:hypothetical protein